MADPIHGARAMTMALGGRWQGHTGLAPCPSCQPERRRDQAALSIAEGASGLLLYCFKAGCTFTDILAAAGLRAGVGRPVDPIEARHRADKERAEVRRKAEQARRLWREAQPIAGTPAERYLHNRGLNCLLPEALRFHEGLWHRSSVCRLPALVAKVEGVRLWAIHRTYLAPDGRGKAPVEPTKAMLGATRGGAVRLSNGFGPLVVCEGIETGLALLEGLVNERPSIWAALSTSGVRALRLSIPRRALFVAPDGDRAGVEAAEALARRAAGEGWDARVMEPPAPGADWADWAEKRARQRP